MTEKISEQEIREHWIQRLPDLPNRPGRYGDAGLSAREMKAAHDALGLCIIRHFNSLLEDIASGELLRTLGTRQMSLEALLLGLEDGRTAEAIRLGGRSLRETLDGLRVELLALCGRINALEAALLDRKKAPEDAEGSNAEGLAADASPAEVPSADAPAAEAALTEALAAEASPTEEHQTEA